MGISKKLTMLVLVFSQAAAAIERPVIAGAGVDDTTLRKHVETQDRRTLAEFIDADRPGEDRELRLRTILETAQRTWLGGSVEKARASFRELADLARIADWKDSQREVILYAQLRLAQSAENPIERAEWLETSARFAPDLTVDASLFPPPLLKELVEVRSSVATKSVSVPLREVFAGFRYVLIDGKKYDLDSASSAKVTPGIHRITALGDRQAPITQDMTSSQLGVFRVSGRPIVEICGPQTATLESGLVVDVLSSNDCPVTAAVVPPGADWAKPPDEIKNRARRDWLWIGAVAVGTAIAISVAKSQKKSETPASVHRDGF